MGKVSMTIDGFRRLALSLPDTSESSHMDHPDFRVSGKIFATLGYPEHGWGMLKLTLSQQSAFVTSSPRVFSPVPGGWGRRGATNVRLRYATAKVLLPALTEAWKNVASRRALAMLDDGT